MARRQPNYLGLRAGLRFVPGPQRGAIYEMETGRVFSVDPLTTRILSLGMENVPLEEIRRKIGSGKTGEKARTFQAVLHHPFVRVLGAPNPAQAPPVAPEARRLEFLWVELTATCNLRCQHCYASSGPDRPPGGMATEDYLRLLREAAAFGCRIVQFTGGEIFLRRDLVDFVREARRLGYKDIELYTNASLIRDSDLDALQELGVRFAVSVYSHRPESHDAITLVPGSWSRTVKTLERIVARGFPVRIGVVRMAENWNDMEETHRYLTGLGIPPGNIRIDTVRPTGRGCEGGLGDPVPNLVRLGPPRRFRPAGDGLSARTCWSGKLAVDPDGNLYPCVFSRELPVGNLKAKSLAEVIGGRPLQDLWSITLEHVEDCNVCEYRYACFDCRLMAYARTGNLLAKPPTCAYRPHDGTVEQAAGMPLKVDRLPPPALPRPRPSVALRRVGGETYLWDRETRAMHLLNATAARIWRWCDGKSTREEIVDRMCRKYRAPRERIDRDVGRTLATLQELGVME